MSEPRFVELETRLAYADEAIQSLSDTVARQQGRIDGLETLCRQMLERIKTADDAAAPPRDPADEVPPHW